MNELQALLVAADLLFTKDLAVQIFEFHSKKQHFLDTQCEDEVTKIGIVIF